MKKDKKIKLELEIIELETKLAPAIGDGCVPNSKDPRLSLGAEC